jgi:uncharacterized protein YndB with AHSA1/START domain
MAKKIKNKKKPKPAKAPAKKVAKKTVAKKAQKAAAKPSKKPKPKPLAKAQPKPKPVVKKSTTGPVEKKQPVKKESSAVRAKSPVPQKAEKKKTPPPSPAVTEQKPKGSPFKLSMALEEKETQPAFVKPRITRSRSGNLLFQLEYTIRSSPAILYEFLTTPSGMAQWFADKVDITDHHCTFEWEGVENHATIIDSIPDEYIRYRWDNSDEDEYFEFRISKNEITGDTILTITDFASEAEMKDQKLLWDSQIKTLVQQVGG